MNPAILGISRLGFIGAVVGVVLYVGYKMFENSQPQRESGHQTRPKRTGQRRPPPSPGNACCVCWEAFSPPLEILPCGHIFHKYCLAEWFDRSTLCPVCRDSLDEEDLKEYRKRLQKLHGD